MSAPRRIGRRIYVIAIATGLLVSALGAGTTPAAAQGPQDVLSHFLCYQGTFPDFDPVAGVRLDDQFATTHETMVIGPRLLCNPVRKTRRSGEVTRIVDRRQHLKAYAIGPLDVVGTREIIDRNQFGREQRLTISREPSRLLVPTRKAPHDPPEGLDHFLCYKVLEGRAADRAVALKDQFGSFRTRVGRPKLHCNPADKHHLPAPPVTIEHEFAHLLCYGIERHRLDPPIGRRTDNQFERARVRSEVAVMLCVPSRKRLLPLS
jgi:hypothetical protein